MHRRDRMRRQTQTKYFDRPRCEEVLRGRLARSWSIWHESNQPVALSFNHTCTATKATMETAKTTNSVITLPLFQGYIVPPHCRAKRRQMMEGTKSRIPIGSNCKIRRRSPVDGCASRAGALKKMRLIAATTTPTMLRPCQFIVDSETSDT